MSGSLQYIIVYVILAAVVAYVIYRLVRKNPGAGGPCCGCALSESCNKKELIQRGKNGEKCTKNRQKS